MEKNFVEEMRELLKKQLSEFELAKKRQQHDAKIVSEEGRKKWLELKDRLKRDIEVINDGLPEPLLSYSENADNELSLKHELSDRDSDMRVAFDPASVVITYEGNKGKGEFRPRVHGEALEYMWDETTPCDGARRTRKISFDSDEPPVPTGRMSEIVLRCVVMSASSPPTS